MQVTSAAMVVGFVVRVLWVMRAADHPPQGLADPNRYLGYADGIARGRGLVEPLTGQVTAYFPPGYPYTLGLIDWVLIQTPLPDNLPLVAGLVQAVIGTVSIGIAALLASRIHSATAGAVAAVAMAVYPNLILHTGAILSETLTILLVLGFLLALIPPPQDPTTGSAWPAGLTTNRVVAAGVVLGVLLLVRPQSAGILIAPAGALLVAGAGWRRTARTVAIVAGIGLLFLAPWTVRNVVRMDALVALSTNTGDNLCIGHGPDATGAFRLAEDCATEKGIQHGTQAELDANDERTSRALRSWRSNWRDEPRLTWERFRVTVATDDDAIWAVQSYGLDRWVRADHARWVSRIANWSWAVVGVTGVVGLARLVWRRSGGALLLPLAVVGLAVAPLLTFGDPRFKVPIVPLLIIAAATLVTPMRRTAEND